MTRIPGLDRDGLPLNPAAAAELDRVVAAANRAQLRRMAARYRSVDVLGAEVRARLPRRWRNPRWHEEVAAMPEWVAALPRLDALTAIRDAIRHRLQELDTRKPVERGQRAYARRRGGRSARGYGTEAKARHRLAIWREFRAFCGGIRATKNSQALLMPAIEGLEIDTALEVGFVQPHLHIVDQNPAVVATLKRYYPQVRTHGVDVTRALARLRWWPNRLYQRERLTCAHFDFCSSVHPALVRRLCKLHDPSCWEECHIIAVTVLRGRDWKLPDTGLFTRSVAYGRSLSWDVPALIDPGLTMLPTDWDRLYLLAGAVSRRAKHYIDASPSAYGIYRSGAGTQTMLWFTVRFWRTW